MSERIHDNEPDTSEPVVRALLQAECPSWADAPLAYLAISGTDNAMWRVDLGAEPDVVVRLPRRPGAAAGLLQEVSVLRQITGSALADRVATPVVRHVGSPHGAFPHAWSVLEWIDGVDAWAGRGEIDEETLAVSLGHTVSAIGSLTGLDTPARAPGDRGGPLGSLLDRLHRWLDDPAWNAAGLIDVAAVRRLAAEACELAEEPTPSTFVHGDLIPGNLLLHDGDLAAVIDWGGAGIGDPAQDLAPAWAVFDTPARSTFRGVVAADDATWIRGRAIELEHAVGGVLYYVPRRHPLGDVMARTLARILDES